MTPTRIGWAAPWNHSSAIAQSASEVAFELARRGHAVTILRTEVGTDRDLPVREAPGAARFMADYGDAELLRDFDVVVGHVGDHYGFHGALLPRLDVVPMVGIFYDFCIAHLVRDHLSGDEGALRALVRSVYRGTPTAEASFAWDDLSYVVAHHPLIEWAAAKTVCAIVHEWHCVGQIERSCAGPVAVVPLAFTVADLPPPPSRYPGALTIAVVGQVNMSKRIDQILLAIGSSPFLRRACHLKVIGPATDHARAALASLAAELGVSPPTFTGWVSDGDLRLALRDVDVIGCLQNPIIEAASASLIVALMSGRPTLVSNHGAYGAVPDGAVLKCAPGQEALDVMLHLETVMKDPGAGLIVGERGRAFAQLRHTAAAYADVLEPLLEWSIAARPVRSAQQILTSVLSDMGLARDDSAAARARATVEALCGPALPTGAADPADAARR